MRHAARVLPDIAGLGHEHLITDMHAELALRQAYDGRMVAVHVLSHEQKHVARTFSTRGIDRFAAYGAWRPGPDGVPLLDGVLATIVCRVTQRVAAGDHTIVLAAPELGEHHADATVTPLVYHDGTYARLLRSA